MTNTAALIAELREKLERATDGPWVATDRHAAIGWRVETDAEGYPNDGWVVASELPGPDAEANAHLIVAAVNNLKLLLDLLASQEETIARLREAMERISGDFGHCGACGKKAVRFTDGCCERPFWEPDDLPAIARAALDTSHV